MEAHPSLEYTIIKGDKTICRDPLFVDTPWQLPCLPSPKFGPGRSSVVECSVMVRRVRSIAHGGPTELFLVSATTGVTKAVVCDILWDGVYKRALAANRK